MYSKMWDRGNETEKKTFWGQSPRVPDKEHFSDEHFSDDWSSNAVFISTRNFFSQKEAEEEEANRMIGTGWQNQLIWLLHVSGVSGEEEAAILSCSSSSSKTTWFWRQQKQWPKTTWVFKNNGWFCHNVGRSSSQFPFSLPITLAPIFSVPKKARDWSDGSGGTHGREGMNGVWRQWMNEWSVCSSTISHDYRYVPARFRAIRYV